SDDSRYSGTTGRRPAMTDSCLTRIEPLRLLLRPAEAALALGVSARTLHTLTATGQLRPIRLRGRGLTARALRYPVDDRRRWMDEQRTGTDGPRMATG